MATKISKSSLFVESKLDVNPAVLKTFEWRIPGMLQEEKIVLCAAYIRQYMHDDAFMIQPLIVLCSSYYCMDNELFSIQDIQCSKVEQSFVSPVFVVCGINFYLELFPRGYNSMTRDTVGLILRTPHVLLLSDGEKMQTTLRLRVKETGTVYPDPEDWLHNPAKTQYKIISFAFSKFHAWRHHGLSFADIAELKTLTILVDIHVDVVASDSASKNTSLSPFADHPLYTLPTVEYTWKIRDQDEVNRVKNAANVACVTSDVFEVFNGLKFYLGLWPNGSRVNREGRLNLYLNLVGGLTRGMTVVLQFVLTFVEYNNTTEPCVHSFVTESNSWGIITLDHWPQTKDLAQFTQFTFKVAISLIDVFRNGVLVTKEYRHLQVRHPKLTVMPALPMQTYTWCIQSSALQQMQHATSVAHVQPFSSPTFPMFGFQFKLICQAITDVEIKIRWMDEDDDDGNTSDVVIMTKYNIMVKEAAVEKCGAAAFEREQKQVSWDGGRLSRRRVVDWDTFTVVLQLELVDVYRDNINVTEQYTKTQ